MPYEWVPYILANLHRSGVEPHEVAQALAATRRLPLPAIGEDGIRTLVICARTLAGRPLMVRVQPSNDDSWVSKILGARELTGERLAEFEAWEAQNR